MHIQNCHTAVDDLHTVICQNVSDGSATTLVYLAQLRGLESHLMFIQNSSEFCHIFRIGIIGAALSSGTCIFVEHQSSSEICGIFLFGYRRIVRVKGCTNIRRKYFGIAHGSAKCQF